MRPTTKMITTLALAIVVSAALAVPAPAAQGSPFDRLGVSSVECDCSFKIDAGGAVERWVFRAEPRVLAVEKRSPAYGHLEKGDYIVAIDGKLIVTGEGGRRFSRMEAGEPVVLTVRRDGRVFDERLVPRRVESETVFDVSRFRGDLDRDFVDLSEQAEELSRLAVEVQRLELDDLPELRLQGLDSLLNNLDFQFEGLSDLNLDLHGLEESLRDLEVDLSVLQEATPAGSFGMGISFSGTVNRVDSGEAEWHFDEPPVVTTVEFGSPAARSGLRTGDALTEIDGVSLDSNEGGERFSRIEPGQSVEFTYERDDREDTVTMTAVDRPESRHWMRGGAWNVWKRDPAQFSMTLGGTRFEVHSDGSVRTRTGDDDVVVIETPDGTFELRRIHK